MKAAFLTKYGSANESFEIRETAKPSATQGEVLIKVEAFGLNFADVMARRGLYRDCPPLPAILGYDVVGEVVEIGEGADETLLGKRVAAFTRFGAYAEYAITKSMACVPIGEMDAGIGTALMTQGATAYYSAKESMTLRTGQHVLIHAAAGGVGSLLVQMAKHKGCTVFGTASAHKHDYLREIGVDHPIDYRNNDFAEVIKSINGDRKLDAIFDNIGGKSVKKGMQLLNLGGRLVTYGGAIQNDGKQPNIFKTLKVLFGFGFYNPVFLLMKSQSIIGVNMLRIADHHPATIQACMEEVVKMTQEGILSPKVGGEFTIDQLAEAHEYLESRKSIGKIIVKWS